MDIPLTKTCPRCGVVGTVTEDPPRHGFGEYFTVVWSRRGKEWRDTMVTAEDLRDPVFGCGYDPA